MSNFHATLLVWPASPVSARLSSRLHRHRVDLKALRSSRQVAEAWRTDTGELGLTLKLTRLSGAHGDLRSMLGVLRADGLSYYAWAYYEHDRVAVGYCHSREQLRERTFAVLPSGEPLIRASELEALLAERSTLDAFRAGLEARFAQGRPRVVSYPPLGRVHIKIEAA